MNTNLKKQLIIFILGLAAMFLVMRSCKEDPEIVKVPIEIEVPVPVVEKEFDTVYVNKPVKVLVPTEDTEKIKKFEKANDSLKKELFKSAVTKREYKTSFEDSIQIINVYAKTTGTLDELKVDYKTKPFKVKLDTLINIKVPTKTKLYIGGDIILPTQQGFNANLSPSIAPGIIVVQKNNKKAYKLSYDIVNKTVNGGIYFKL